MTVVIAVAADIAVDTVGCDVVTVVIAVDTVAAVAFAALGDNVFSIYQAL